MNEDETVRFIWFLADPVRPAGAPMVDYRRQSPPVPLYRDVLIFEDHATGEQRELGSEDPPA